MEDVHRKNETKEIENKQSPAPKADIQKNEKKGAKQPQKKKSFVKLVNWKWVVTAFLSSLVISILLSVLSSEVLSAASIAVSILILLSFIALGVIFDIVGLAVATADIKPFHSMASQKIKAGKTAINLIKKAEQVSSFCNDVIGDICGVVSGSAAATIAVKIVTSGSGKIWSNLILCGLVSAITVGSKAVGKALGFNYSVQIVTIVAKILSFFTPGAGKKKNSKKKNKAKKEEDVPKASSEK